MYLLIQLLFFSFRTISIEILAHVHRSYIFSFCRLGRRILYSYKGFWLIKWVQILWSLYLFKGIIAVIIKGFFWFFRWNCFSDLFYKTIAKDELNQINTIWYFLIHLVFSKILNLELINSMGLKECRSITRFMKLSYL